MSDEIKNIVASMFGLLSQYEVEYRLPQGFLRLLLDEDDWSFVIKTHALIEAAVSNLLAAALDSRLLPAFQQLALGEKQTGKLVFAEALGLLDRNDIKFIQKLSELRNKLAHDVRQVGFSFQVYMEDLDPKQLVQFLRTLTSFSTEVARSKWIQTSKENPKLSMWLFAVRIILSTSIASMKATLDKEILKHAYDQIALEKREQNINRPEGSKYD